MFKIFFFHEGKRPTTATEKAVRMGWTSKPPKWFHGLYIMVGNNLIISLNGSAIAAAKSCNIERSISTIETSSPMDGADRTYIVGRGTWKITVNVLVTNVKSILLKVGQIYTLSFGARDSSTDTLCGDAICTHTKVTGTRFNLVQGSFEFLGTGALNEGDS